MRTCRINNKLYQADREASGTAMPRKPPWQKSRAGARQHVGGRSEKQTKIIVWEQSRGINMQKPCLLENVF